MSQIFMFPVEIQVLPHPSFVYAVKWLSKSLHSAFVATGGRDCLLRIWKIATDDTDTDIELCDELIQHDNYISCLEATRKSSKLYSADWNGELLEWSRKKSSKERCVSPNFRLKRLISI